MSPFITMYLVPFSAPLFLPAMACITENTRHTQTRSRILVKVIKLRKFPTMSSFRLFCLEPLLNLSFLKTITAKFNTKEKQSMIVRRNSFDWGNSDTAAGSP